MPLADPSQQFDPGHRDRGGLEPLEPEHRTDPRLHAPMVLLREVIQVLRRSQLRVSSQFTVSLHLAHCAVRCGLAVQRDGPRARALTFDRLAEERLGRGNVTLWAETEVNGISCAIDRPVEIDPSTLDFHLGLVHTPRRTGRLREAVPPALEFRRIVVHPPHDGGVGYRQAALLHHLHEFPEAELEAQISPHAQDDHFAVEVPPLEQILQVQEPGHRAALKATKWLARYRGQPFAPEPMRAGFREGSATMMDAPQKDTAVVLPPLMMTPTFSPSAGR